MEARKRTPFLFMNSGVELQTQKRTLLFRESTLKFQALERLFKSERTLAEPLQEILQEERIFKVSIL